MRRFTIIACAVLLSIVGLAQAQDPAPTPPPAAAISPEIPASTCGKRIAQSTQRAYVRTVYHRARVSRRALRRLERLERCAYSEQAARNMQAEQVRQGQARRARARAALIARSRTPYRCSFGRSAIPCHVVACESGGDWTAANPSGAIGRYQLKGKGAPWPVTSEADRREHDRIAHNLWAGGAGAHHWAECL